MTRVYYKQATACVIIFDITRRSTFLEVLKWKADLDNKTRLPSGDLLPCLLVANKCDLPARSVLLRISSFSLDVHSDDTGRMLLCCVDAVGTKPCATFRDG